MLQARASLGKRSTLKRSQSVDGVTGPESGAHLASHPCDCRAACARCRVGRYCRFRDPFRVVWCGLGRRGIAFPYSQFSPFPLIPFPRFSVGALENHGLGKVTRTRPAIPTGGPASSDLRVAHWMGGMRASRVAANAIPGQGPNQQGCIPQENPSAAAAQGLPRPVKA